MTLRLIAPSALALAAVLLSVADAPGVDTAGINPAVKPGDDFFAYHHRP